MVGGLCGLCGCPGLYTEGGQGDHAAPPAASQYWLTTPATPEKAAPERRGAQWSGVSVQTGAGEPGGSAGSAPGVQQSV